MANPEHLDVLKKGVPTWNKWRNKHPKTTPDFSGAHLTGAELMEADLTGSDLSAADLSGANLTRANLTRANLTRALIMGTDLSGAHLANTNFTRANLTRANLTRALITGANLSRAYLTSTDLSLANLMSADLTGATLWAAFLLDTNLSGANLTGATLWAAVLSHTNLSGADFSDCEFSFTSFCNVDLSDARGLSTAKHRGPSTIGIDTIVRSHGKVPHAFLRGAGVPENFVEYMTSLTGIAFEYYSCFISYSSDDKSFADQLHEDLQAAGVRCWFAPEDMKIGQKMRPGLDEAIRVHDKLLLVLSEHSVASKWVEKEVETAFDRESVEKTVLFPVRVDDAVFKTDVAWANDIRRTRHIGDFTNWKDHDKYQTAFKRLLRDLKAGDKPEPPEKPTE